MFRWTKMSDERAVLLPDWPRPTSGAPMPVVVADEWSLFLRYYTRTDKVAVVHFPACHDVRFGSPNDEALNGHPLWGRGLGFYSVHYVENSSWISLLEQRNSVHPKHDRKWFLKNKKHYIFTFHDSTLECVVDERESCPTEFSQFDGEVEADAFIQEKIRSLNSSNKRSQLPGSS
jgi:hypothetical protein